MFKTNDAQKRGARVYGAAPYECRNKPPSTPRERSRTRERPLTTTAETPEPGSGPGLHLLRERRPCTGRKGQHRAVRVLAVADSDQASGLAYFDALAAAVPYQAERRDDPVVILTAADPGALRELIRADYWARPVPREVAP